MEVRNYLEKFNTSFQYITNQPYFRYGTEAKNTMHYVRINIAYNDKLNNFSICLVEYHNDDFTEDIISIIDIETEEEAIVGINHVFNGLRQYMDLICKYRLKGNFIGLDINYTNTAGCSLSTDRAIRISSHILTEYYRHLAEFKKR